MRRRTPLDRCTRRSVVGRMADCLPELGIQLEAQHAFEVLQVIRSTTSETSIHSVSLPILGQLQDVNITENQTR